MMSWKPNGAKTGESWTVANRWSSFKELHSKLEKKLFPTVKTGEPPKFPSTVVSSSKEKRQQARQERLQTYLDDVFKLIDDDEALGKHAGELESIFDLGTRMSKIKRALAMRNDAKKAEDQDMEGDEVHVYPMNSEEIVQAGTLVQQLWRLLKAHPLNSDIRQNDNVQKMLSSALGILPQVQESARVGPFTIMALLPYAQQY